MQLPNTVLMHSAGLTQTFRQILQEGLVYVLQVPADKVSCGDHQSVPAHNIASTYLGIAAGDKACLAFRCARFLVF